ncbi:prepilin peptidase [Pseudonocardia sp.]|uniref:prepilin peptidase n=1 Tax=Pseudonocardia sp. TaxID=60912 RepID=UPI00262C51A7|nr:prepilin peptidase [Pseudonocardia sp.]
MIVVAALAGPAVLLIVQHTVHTAIRLRPLASVAVGAAAGSLVGLLLTLAPQRMVLLLPLAVLGCAAAVVDAHEGRLPDMLTWPLLLGTLLAGILTAEGNGGVVTLLSVLTGGGVAIVFKTVVSAGFGWGDAKLVPTLAVVLARHDAVVAGIVAVTTLVAVTALLVGIRRADRYALVPYGPAMVVGTLGAAAL